MKTSRILTILVLALGLMVCSAEVSEAAEIGTAFTYQGRLIDANDAADGLYDFAFKLYDANVGGSKAANDVNVADVDVIEGYFTVELDFNDVNSFNGDARWLEIGVRPGDLNDPNVYTVLEPRQEITPVPYALQTRGIFVDNTGNVGIGTTSPEVKLEVRGDDNLIRARATSDFEGRPRCIQMQYSGSVGPLLQGDGYTRLTIDAYAGEAGDIVLGRDGDDVGIGTTSPGAKLHLAGYGCDQANIRLTNTHPQGNSWELQTGISGVSDKYFGIKNIDTGMQSLTIKDFGNIGVGTATPNSKLEVAGIVHSTSGGFKFPDGTTQTTAAAGGGGGIDGSGTVNRVPKFTASTTLGDSQIYENAGNVGIGNASSGKKLEVAGEGKFDGALFAQDTTGIGLKDDTGNLGLWVEDGGNVGIGTDTPDAKLHVKDGAVLFDGTSGGTPASGTGRRLMWIPLKSAFRAGYVGGDQWDDGNIGTWSVAMGEDTKANGQNSTALGNATIASGVSSTAMGQDTEANGDYSTAMGRTITVNGEHSVGIGLSIGSYTVDVSRVLSIMGGYVGIGTTDPGTYKLAVNGSAAKPGGGSWSTFSDIRLKDISGNYEYGLAEIVKLKPVRYKYKKDNGLGLPANREFAGVVSQDVLCVIPEAVEEHNDGHFMVNNDPIIWAMVNAIKELNAENGMLKQKIKALEGKMEGLQKQ